MGPIALFDKSFLQSLSLDEAPPPVITRRGKTTIRRYRNRSFHRFKRSEANPSTSSSSTPRATTMWSRFALRTRPPCTSPSPTVSLLNPDTLTGRPATGVASRVGHLSVAQL